MTTAIVLAAGVGRRLAGVSALPKWLVPVGRTCPATEQLGALDGLGITDVRVVVGEQVAEIEAHIEPWRTRLHLDLIPNEHSTTRNNWYSLLVGLRSWSGGSDVLVLNSDLFAERSWFEKSIVSVRATEQPAAIGVDPTRGRTDEAMKVGLDPSGTRVVQIGKTGVDRPAGEYVGLAWWDEEAATALMATLEEFIDQPSRTDHWYEHGIQEHLDAGRIYGAAAVVSPAWVEIDDPRDLEMAIELVAGRAP